MVTLDIEDTVINMMVVKGKRVELAVSLNLEPGLVEDGVVMDKSAVSQRIRELMQVHDVSEKNVVVSINGIHSIYRLVRMPRLPKGFLEEAAKREMARVMPVPARTGLNSTVWKDLEQVSRPAPVLKKTPFLSIQLNISMKRIMILTAVIDSDTTTLCSSIRPIVMCSLLTSPA